MGQILAALSFSDHMSDDEIVKLEESQMQEIYAHTPAIGSSTWHLLKEHLEAVATSSQQFATAFDAGEVAYWVGLWHDIGKCHHSFQTYLLNCHANPSAKHRGPDHKAAGTLLSIKHIELLAWLIQGHHGGLRSRKDLKTWLSERSQDPAPLEAIERVRSLLLNLEPAVPLRLPSFVSKTQTTSELFVRMLFSALVDADFLDTEQFRNVDKATRRVSGPPLSTLWERFERKQQLVSGKQPDLVSHARHMMYLDCLAAAAQPPGLFRLAIPTGGGKTRSAMAFALRHALHNNQQRVIVAVPFISITEQTAATYRELFNADDTDHPVVLEHHSGVDAYHTDSDGGDAQHDWRRLAAENWDAPIIVTTTVQLFESLFANQTSRCRKLHRLAQSVIILDEAQALPRGFLTPILDVLRQLCEHYGTTVVIATATQPAFESIPIFASLKATNIVPNAIEWFQRLKRVRYEWRIDTPVTWTDIATMMGDERQVLCIVNTKRDANILLDRLEDQDIPDVLHLSTQLCGAHRRAVIAEIQQRLQVGEPCRVVATQVIEAGVDLDFPLVLRALGPLDSIIQAAGRANREGRLEQGRVIVFQPEGDHLPSKDYRTATDITRLILKDEPCDPDHPDTSSRYFRQLFDNIELDRHGIQALRKAFNYPEVAQEFRMIDELTENVVVFYGTDDDRCQLEQTIEQIKAGSANMRQLFRRLQPYIVAIRKDTAQRYHNQHFIEQFLPSLGIWRGVYDSLRGLVAEDDRDAWII